MDEDEARRAVIAACLALGTAGLNQGTSGNISVRHAGRMLITPSATPYERMRPEQLAALALQPPGASADPAPAEAWSGPLPPSTEWRFHRDILQVRPEIGAVVHAHPTFCTALAMARRPIPACHYMVAAFGGTDVRCAPYATFGTAELSAHALAALEGRTACLLANHGMIVCGPTLDRALWLGVELETLARQYVHSLQLGGPVLLSDAEVAAAARGFASYGLREG